MVIKTYSTETPLNSAALAPNRPYVRLNVVAFILILLTSSVGAFGRRTGSHERYYNVRTTGQI
jgi:hypothetical protein